MSVTWPNNVNSDAYDLQTGTTDNYTEITFENGTKRRFLKNSESKQKFTFSIALKDDCSQACEYAYFWAWYKDDLLSGVKNFYFPDLTNKGTLTEYRMTSTPSASGQKTKTIRISCEEV